MTALPGDARVFTGGDGKVTNVVGLDFGQVVVGPCEHQTLQLWNTGREDLILTSVDLGTSGSVFEIGAVTGMRVTPGGPPQDLPIVFCPRQEGTQTARILLGTNSRAVPILTVNMEGTAQIVIEQFLVQPQQLDFGSVLTGTSSTLSVSVTNPGQGTVFLCPQSPQGMGASVFSVPRSIPVGPQQSAQVPVTLIPTSGEALSASFEIRLGSDVSCLSLLNCPNCAAKVELTAQPVLRCVRIVDPEGGLLNFGYASALDPGPTGGAQPYMWVPGNVVATNDCPNQVLFFDRPRIEADLPPDAGSAGDCLPTPFELVDGGTLPPLPPGGSVSIPMLFKPRGLSICRATMSLSSNDPRAVSIGLAGTGGGPKIQCSASVLDFGPTAVGGPADTQQKILTCTNLGQYPLSFTAAGSQLPTTDGVFRAWFASATPVELNTFQSTQIIVAFNPTAEGPASAKLTIANDDPLHSNLQVDLTGTGVAAAPCTLGVTPTGPLDFGQVLDPPYAYKTLTVTNLGSTACTLSNFATDAIAFRVLAADSLDPLVLAPGASQDLNVQFAPPRVGPRRSYFGSLTFYAAGASPPNQLVSLQGTAGAACLHLSPNPMDFGQVGFNAAASAWCASAPKTLTVTSECAPTIPIRVLSVSTLAAPDFTVSGLAGSGPWPIAIGQPLTFQVSYTPSAAGPAGAQSLTLNANDATGAYQLPLLGAAELPKSQVDNFAGHAKQLDVLWVVDTDDDAATQEQLITALDGFLAQARALGIDFQMGVTAMSYGSLGQKLGVPSDNGWLEPCARCIGKGDGSDPAPAATLITPATQPDPSPALALLLNLGAPLSASMRQELSTNQADEQFFETLLDALQPPLLAQHNANFLRPNASLAVLALNGDSSEDDESPGSIDSYLSFVLGALPTQSSNVFSFSYLRNESYGLSPPKGGRLAQFVQRTGGQDVDLTQPGWPAALNQVWIHFLSEFPRYPLSAQPVDPNPFDAALHPNGVQLTINSGPPVPAVDGTGAQQWSYDPVSNAILFAPVAVPAAGDAIAVTYPVGCGP